MGLYVHSLVEIPLEAKRSYYIYLLDYGWKEPLKKALTQNFAQMAEIASKNNAVVIRSSEQGTHFQDEVFSWHDINGEEGDVILPAILVTDRHPHEFKEGYDYRRSRDKQDFRIILIPLKKYCSFTTDVVNYIHKIFNDIVEKKDLANFQ